MLLMTAMKSLYLDWLAVYKCLHVYKHSTSQSARVFAVLSMEEKEADFIEEVHVYYFLTPRIKKFHFCKQKKSKAICY